MKLFKMIFNIEKWTHGKSQKTEEYKKVLGLNI